MVSFSQKLVILLLSCLAFLLVAGDSKSKGEQSLDDRVGVLSDWMLRRPVIKMNNDKYKQYVRGTPRNYSVVLMLTAMSSRRGCQICQQAYEEFEIIANSYRYAYLYSKRIFFAMVDFDDGQEVFTSLGLNSAPVIMHFPQKGKPKPADTMDISRVGFNAEAIAKFIQDRTDVQVRVLRPPNYAGPLLFLLVALLVGGLLYMRRNNLEFLYNRTSWGIAALCIILAFMSGQMWNHIRGPPLMHRNQQTGAMSYIHGSNQGQFILETYLVFALYAAITFGFIIMNDAAEPVPRNSKEDPTKRRVKACVGLGIILIVFSFMLSIFRQKYRGYPYSFLFK